MGRRHTDSRAPGGELLGPLLIVSPHFDDVPFSCWALLDRRDLATVLHVCTAGPVPPVVAEWDRRSGFADSDAATAARRAEERDAFAGTPHLFREVGLLDGQYTDVRTVDELRRISDAVHAWVDEVDAPCTVAVPVGAGCVEGALVPIARLRARLTRSSRLRFNAP